MMMADELARTRDSFDLDLLLKTESFDELAQAIYTPEAYADTISKNREWLAAQEATYAHAHIAMVALNELRVKIWERDSFAADSELLVARFRTNLALGEHFLKLAADAPFTGRDGRSTYKLDTDADSALCGSPWSSWHTTALSYALKLAVFELHDGEAAFSDDVAPSWLAVIAKVLEALQPLVPAEDFKAWVDAEFEGVVTLVGRPE